MNQKGQITVELAIIIPLALFIIFALAELCFMYNAKQVALLGAFRSARSYAVTKRKSSADSCMYRTLKTVTFRNSADNVSYLEINEHDNKIFLSVVYLYKPLFPILPLANFLGHSLFSDNHSSFVEAAVRIRSNDRWAEKIKTHVPITAGVELYK